MFFWEEVYARRASLAKGRQVLFGHIKSSASALSLVINTVIYVGIIQSLVSVSPMVSRYKKGMQKTNVTI